MSPQELKLLEGGRVLSVVWDDGQMSRVGADVLRRHSRSASARRAEIDGEAPRVANDVRLIDIRLVGAYAVQLVFSDGHDRGIYPWVYLRELAAAAG
jgi:DUF971 family protein